MPPRQNLARPWRVLLRLGRARRASTAVEFALTGLALFLFLLAIVNLGMLGFSLGALVRGVQSAARTAAVNAAANYATTGAITCPSNAAVVGYFNSYADPPLPAATTSATGNPTITAAWTDNTSGAVTSEPQGVYLTLTGTYKWLPIGFSNFGSSGIKLSITTVAEVMGSATETATC
jgi:Flp pilus assembly protein TadG